MNPIYTHKKTNGKLDDAGYPEASWELHLWETDFGYVIVLHERWSAMGTAIVKFMPTWDRDTALEVAVQLALEIEEQGILDWWNHHQQSVKMANL